MNKRIKFQPKPVAKAAAVFSILAMGSSALYAGPGFGDSKDVVGTPIVVPSYYANSPAGARQWDATGAPAGFSAANKTAYVAKVNALYPNGYPGTGTALRKFVDSLPLPAGHALAATNLPQLSDGTPKYIPKASITKWVNPQGLTTTDDYVEIAAVEYSEKLHSDLKKATTLRGYVQIDHVATNGLTIPDGAGGTLTALPGSKKVALTYPNGTAILVAQTDANGKLTGAKVPAIAYDTPHYLGPIVSATRNTPTRVKFLNLLPVGRAVAAGTTVAVDAAGKPLRNGDLFLPHDDTLAGAGIGPDGAHTYTENRVNLHLQGGQAPWISAGGPHSWITPAGEADAGLAGSVASQVLDPLNPLDPTLVGNFLRGPGAINVPDMNDPGAGAMTYYFPNSESARLQWVRDQSVGIDRLNTYAGLALIYDLADPAETSLLTTPVGAVPGVADTIPLVIQDKTFVPDDIKLQDAKWDVNAWGATGGDLWYPHVYEKIQDATQASGFNATGRWHWGPSFWPSTPALYDVPTGDYRDAAGLSQATVVPEAFMDTPLVNGVAYPTLKVEAKPYRLRILNASNDRFVTFNLFVASDKGTTTGTTSPLGLTEVQLRPVETWATLCAPGVTKSDGICTPELWTTDVYANPAGVPDWKDQGPTLYQIASEGGVLPGVAPKDATPLSYLLDKGRAAVLNVDYGATGLQLSPSERADVVVDFAQYAGKTLIVYNDSGSPVPGSDPRNEYVTDYGDQSVTGGAENTRPGYGPNVRTMMQIVVGAAPAVVPPAVDPTALDTAVKAAYLATQETPIVAQSAYNGVYGAGKWNDTLSFASIFTGTVKEPMFTYVPGTPNLAFNSILLQTPGNGYTRIPSISINGGGGTGATADTSLKIASLPVINHGTGYTLAPTVTIVATNRGNAATATASLGVNKVTINATGNTGYSTATPPLVTFSKPTSPGGVQALGTAVVSAAGKVTGITISNPGKGYTIPATVTIAAPAAGLVATGSTDMGVYELPLDLPDPTKPETAGGGGYDDLSTAASEPANPNPGLTITITAPQKAGGVTASAGALGRLVGISLTNSGTGYTSAPTVVITPSALEPAPATITAATALADTAVVGGAPTSTLYVKTKAIQELWEPTYGRYNTTFGTELPFTSANVQTTMPLNYVDVPTEELTDGETQIWKITHNGLLTQSIHFSMADVQLINRVGWDNYNTPPELNELGWKDTIKLSPLEDGVIAIRARKPKTGGFGLPNSVRSFDPSQPDGSMNGFTQIDPFTGVPAPVANMQQDYGWEYLWQGTVLGRDPVDFMRPVIFHANEAVPLAPTGLTGTAVGTTANLAWVDNSVTEFSYRIERSPKGAATWTAIGVGLANAAAYADTTFGAGVDYDYRVWAVGQNGETVSNVATVAAPPLAPTGLVITADTASTVSLKWTDGSTNETSFLLSWNSLTAAGGSISVPSATVAVTGGAITNTVLGLTANTLYNWSVVAVNAAGQSVPSTTSGTTAPVAVTALAATSTAAAGVATLNLGWTNANPNLGTLTSVVITGAVGGVTITPVSLTGAAIAATATQTLTNLAPASAYTITVTVNGLGGSAATTLTGTTAISAPVTPANFRVTADTVNSVSLAWTDVVGETSYALAWTSATAAAGSLPALAANTVSGTAAGLVANTAYSFTLGATNAGGTATAGPVVGTTAPVAVTGLAATTVAATGSATVNLTWANGNPNIGTLTSVVISGTVGGVAIAPVTQSGATANGAAALTGLTQGATYSLTVTVNGVGGSAAATVTGTTASSGLVVAAPGTPTAVISFPTNRVTLTWVDNSNNEADFIVQRSSDGGATFTNVGAPVTRSAAQRTAVGGNVSFVDTTLVAGTSYVYRVVAQNVTGTVTTNSAPSGTVTVFYGLATPGTPTAVIASATRVTLSWIDNSVGEASFAVWRSDNGAAAVQIGTVTRTGAQGTAVGGTVTFNNNSLATPLAAGHTYTYYVTAVNGTVVSVASATVSVPFLAPVAPAAPTVAVTSNTGGTGSIFRPFTDTVVVSWAAVPGATSYTVRRIAPNGTATTVANNTTALTVTQTGVAKNATVAYTYQVRANNVVGSSAYTAKTVIVN